MVMLKQFHNSFIHHSYNRASRGAQYHAIITSGAFAKSLQMMIQKYFFSCSNENQYTRNQFYLRCVLSWGCIIVKPFSIVAVLQIVLCNPLSLVSITSLCCHTCHSSVQNNQINLEPLIRTITFSRPRSRFVRIYKMKSALSGGVFRISLKRRLTVHQRYHRFACREIFHILFTKG